MSILSQEYVLEQMEWRPTEEGHDERCHKRHFPCAQTYIGRLLTLVMQLDSELRQVTSDIGLERIVAAAVHDKVVQMVPGTLEMTVCTTSTAAYPDPLRDDVVAAAREWAAASAEYERLSRRYNVDDRLVGLPMPDEVNVAGRRLTCAERALRRTLAALGKSEEA